VSRTRKLNFARACSGLDNQCNASGRGELDGVARKIEQHLPQPRGIANDFNGSRSST